jgi:hypothetical protein
MNRSNEPSLWSALLTTTTWFKRWRTRKWVFHSDHSIHSWVSLAICSLSGWITSERAISKSRRHVAFHPKISEQYCLSEKAFGHLWHAVRWSSSSSWSAVKCNWEKSSFSATVYGLWVAGEPYRVSSGYITKDTKVINERKYQNDWIRLRLLI